MIKISLQLTEEDLFNFSFANWKAPFNENVRTWNFLYLLFFGFIGAFIAFSFSKKNPTPIDILVITGIAFASVFLYRSLTIRISIKNKVRALLNDPGNRNSLLPCEIIIDKESIQMIDEISNLRYNWKAISKSLENRNYYFLYLNSLQAVVIKKSLMNAEEINMLSSFITENIPTGQIFQKK